MESTLQQLPVGDLCLGDIHQNVDAQNQKSLNKSLGISIDATGSEGSKAYDDDVLDGVLSPFAGARTAEIGKICCGGGCCRASMLDASTITNKEDIVILPRSEAFQSLRLQLGSLRRSSRLTNVVDLPAASVALDTDTPQSTPIFTTNHPPSFVTPHAPYSVFSSRVHHARELTRSGALKRTYHFDLDVTDYPAEGGDVDFVVGGAIGVQAPNAPELVDEILDLLGIPRIMRDKPVTVKTTGGRWPTIWGEEQARTLISTRRELLTWCSDVQSFPPTKSLLRILAEYAEDGDERKILLYLVSAQGQAAFCDLRTGPHITLAQLLSAFPSSRPPLNLLLGALNAILPRLYSLSHDPQVSCGDGGADCRRLIEIAVTVHESPNWRGGPKVGLGSGYLERLAKQFVAAEASGTPARDLDFRVPMFRGLMSNPLAREFATEGPMLLIGAGVGIAPFRGFVQRRLKAANCANKVWVLQGVRDSLLDELYSGEWGVDEKQLKTVVQSRRGNGRYVQEEVRHQADLVWFVINSLDGRIFVCGGSEGMGHGVEQALMDVAKQKGPFCHEEAAAFWQRKKDGAQYIVVGHRFGCLSMDWYRSTSHNANFRKRGNDVCQDHLLRSLGSVRRAEIQQPRGSNQNISNPRRRR